MHNRLLAKKSVSLGNLVSMAQLHSAQYDTGDVSYLIASTIGVLIMIPGVGLLYSGLARRKSALSMIWLTLMSGAMGMFQWWFWGYSLALSTTATNGFIGNLRNFALRNILDDAPDAAYPELLFAVFQGMFCALTCAIAMGGIAERGRLFPAIVFTFVWATAVYCPLAAWAWQAEGWAGSRWGVLDYAGGGPVEIGSGLGGAAYALVLGRRKEKLLLNFRPHNVSLVTIGTVLLWFGWLGFNGGTAAGANLKAVYAVYNSNITAVFAAFTWVLLDWRLERKWSTVAVCSGIVSGLVAATPASGIIPMWASVVLGVVAGAVCNFSTQIKYLVSIDDSMDVFAEHGVAGIIGLLFNALFGADWVIGLDGSTEHPGGWLSHNWKQIYKQIAYIAACFGYTFVVTVIIALAIDKIPYIGPLRVNESAEERGIDEDQIGEFAYDYVEVRRDYLSWSPPVVHVQEGESAVGSPAPETNPKETNG